MSALLLRARNSGIGHLYLRANSLNDRDDRERNACGDQAVFNCRRRSFILGEPVNKLSHV
jgi:hypothetical protein